MLLSALIGLINFFILYWAGRKKEKNYIKEWAKELNKAQQHQLKANVWLLGNILSETDITEEAKLHVINKFKKITGYDNIPR